MFIALIYTAIRTEGYE
ncbi:adenine phosphoribosyltransferase, partial [Vibrio harveyi]